MPKKISILQFETISTIFIIVVGTLLHFTFEWSNNNLLVGTFSAVNESTWEHLKLLFVPMLITLLVGYFYFKDNYSNYLCIKTKGIIIALSFLVIFYYTYTGVLGKNIAFLNIGSFIVAAILGELYTLKKIDSYSHCYDFVSIIILVIFSFSFIIFTFNPPHIGLFKDPVTETYGIKNNS